MPCNNKPANPYPPAGWRGAEGDTFVIREILGISTEKRTFTQYERLFQLTLNPEDVHFFAAKEDGLKIIWEEPWRANKNK